MNLTRFILERLPHYYKENDTYKNAQGNGILERFLLTLGIELQEELIDKLESFTNELDPLTATNEFLSQIAYALGNPSDILGHEESYRIRLMSAITLYKVKGTLKSYELLFSLLGYEIELTVNFPKENLYDIGLTTDMPITEYEGRFDLDECSVGCLNYKIDYWPIPGKVHHRLSSAQTLLLMDTIAKDLQPIDGKLIALNYTGQGPEDWGFDYPLDFALGGEPITANSNLDTKFNDLSF